MNVGMSVRHRLLNLSRENGADFGLLLSNYVLERFLYRLGRSEHRARFVLKGAVLFRLWSDERHRPTRDLDLLAFGNPEASEIGKAVRDICRCRVEDDGVVFLPETLRMSDIREGRHYQGVRVRIDGTVGGARVPLQIDVGVGDAVEPSVVEMSYPGLLDFPAPVISAYPRESVVAEKLQAMVELAVANSRMKDFYDLYFLATRYAFDGASLCAAIKATFRRRHTSIPESPPIALTTDFGLDITKVEQWRAFMTRGGVTDPALTLDAVVSLLCLFLLPPMGAAASDEPFDKQWAAFGPWSSHGNP